LASLAIVARGQAYGVAQKAPFAQKFGSLHKKSPNGGKAVSDD
jgi:hypothetical protein